MKSIVGSWQGLRGYLHLFLMTVDHAHVATWQVIGQANPMNASPSNPVVLSLNTKMLKSGPWIIARVRVKHKTWNIVMYCAGVERVCN